MQIKRYHFTRRLKTTATFGYHNHRNSLPNRGETRAGILTWFLEPAYLRPLIPLYPLSFPARTLLKRDATSNNPPSLRFRRSPSDRNREMSDIRGRLQSREIERWRERSWHMKGVNEFPVRNKERDSPRTRKSTISSPDSSPTPVKKGNRFYCFGTTTTRSSMLARE